MNPNRPQHSFLLEPPPREGWKLALIGLASVALGLLLLAASLAPTYF